MDNTQASSRKKYGVMLGVVVCLLITTVAVFILHPTAQTWYHSIVSGYARMNQLASEMLPSVFYKIYLKGAGYFFTPWLYLLILVVFLAERYIPVREQQPFFSKGMIQDFFTWFLLDSVLRFAVVLAITGVIATLYQKYLSFLTLQSAKQLPILVQAILALLVSDFLAWLNHLVRHKVPFFWVFHTIHHAQREMNIFTDVRFHAFEQFVATPILILPMMILGLTFETAGWVLLIITCHSRIYHANIKTNFGWLRYILVTPQSHRVHHSDLPQHMDKNFGVTLSVWDQMFGTQYRQWDDYPGTGIPDEEFPHETSVTPPGLLITYIRQLWYPFRAIHHWSKTGSWEIQPPIKKE